jgi:hypothetical protein
VEAVDEGVRFELASVDLVASAVQHIKQYLGLALDRHTFKGQRAMNSLGIERGPRANDVPTRKIVDAPRGRATCCERVHVVDDWSSR